MAEELEAKHQIFLVHGMGNFAPSWGDTIWEQIAGLFNKYSILKQGKYVNDFGFKEITYNDEFDAWRTQWANDAKATAAALTALGLDGGIAQALLKLATSIGANKFLQTHVLDVVLCVFHSKWTPIPI